MAVNDERRHMAGQMVHLEIPAGNTAKAKEFWGGLFGWQFEEMPGAPGGYHMTRFSETTGGAIYGADGDKRGTRTYFDVDDVNAGLLASRSRRPGGRPSVPRWAGSQPARTTRATSSGSATTERPGVGAHLEGQRSGSPGARC
jgi:predicted enzyme related to lactoylglutathione lyase